jgi:hypothetical protein
MIDRDVKELYVGTTAIFIFAPRAHLAAAVAAGRFQN